MNCGFVIRIATTTELLWLTASATKGSGEAGYSLARAHLEGAQGLQLQDRKLAIARSACMPLLHCGTHHMQLSSWILRYVSWAQNQPKCVFACCFLHD